MHETTLVPGTKAFLIARVSDPGQRDALPGQELRLNQYAERYQLDGKMFSFDESAFKEARTQFEAIVKEIITYPQYCIAVFDKVDRLTRDSSAEVVRVLKHATKNGKIELHFPSENLVLRKGAPAVDWTRFTMGAAFAEYYSGAISDNVKRRIEQKLHYGEWPGKAPIGYMNVDKIVDGRVTKDVVPDPQRADGVRRMFALRVQGLSYRVIARELRVDGLTGNTAKKRPIHQSVVEMALKNPFYYGVMLYSGQKHQHRYEPLISKETFDEAQRVSQSRGTGGSKPKSDTKQTFTFQGILKCGYCGCSISSYVRKGHTYMICSRAKGECKQKHLKEREVLPEASKIIEKSTIKEIAIKEVLDALKSKHDNEQFYYQTLVKNSKAEYDRLQKRLEVAYEDRMDGRITVNQYDTLAAKYKAEQEALDRKMVQATDGGHDSFIIDSEYLLKLTALAPILFESSKPELKNRLLKILLSNLEINENHLSYKRWLPVDALTECLESSNWLRRLDSNQRPRS